MTFLGSEDGISYKILHAPVFDGFLEFDVRAHKDVEIALLSSFDDPSAPKILIGGWDNSKSAIMSCLSCNPEVLSVPSQFLNSSLFTHFWINLTSNGTIKVGKGYGTEPFMQWTNPNLPQVKYIGYRADGIDGVEFKFCDFGKYAFPTSTLPSLFQQSI